MPPMYEYRCDCGWSIAVIRCMKDRDKKLFCDACGAPARREQSVPMVIVKNPAVPRKGR